MGRKAVDLTGMRFGKLVALEYTGKSNRSGAIWKCRCDCGNITYATNSHLRSGGKTSCGCLYDLTGRKFGKLTAIEKIGKTKHGAVIWKCLCECGNYTNATQNILVKGEKTSCGCGRKMRNYDDLTNQRFGRLVAIKPTEKRKHRCIMWECKCDCGNTVEVMSRNLLCGKTKSCGCLYLDTRGNEKHGMHNMRIYYTHKAIIQRCYNRNNPEYHNYGGRGITVCDEWIGEHGFERFFKWAMENGYSEELTIDRINNNGNYEPSNCRWVTYIRQQNNKRTNHYLTYNGKTQSMADWAREIGLNYGTLASRIRSGWTVERALTTQLCK